MSTKQKFKNCGFLILFFFAFYFFFNTHYHGDPIIIGETFIDRMIPFNAHWIWVYLLSFPLFPLTYFGISDDESRSNFSKSYVLTVLISCMIFYFFPTTVLRHAYPVETQGTLAILAFKILRAVDNPVNCFPSLHVSTACLGVFFFSKESWGKFYGMLVLAISISLSTMFVKQHLFWDVLGGGVTAVVSYSFVKAYGEEIMVKLRSFGSREFLD